ncbi:uncharacterized protein I206_100121 [Kwoniella pini CBS 10737]|uniref:Uncharacterized protein n=1 Tax=Kwoniella pini CBS 10737 TaxID=1296096 RepID=A0A1B9IE34_9TREE|nr:uncharacterized protein I206_01206 [Kwoniella pini CBS 10737]OCF53899.1 hypothetical protein I206_01206 [Kwoniella pini CBS 10737]
MGLYSFSSRKIVTRLKQSEHQNKTAEMRNSIILITLILSLSSVFGIRPLPYRRHHVKSLNSLKHRAPVPTITAPSLGPKDDLPPWRQDKRTIATAVARA